MNGCRVWSQTITPTLLLGVVMEQVNARSGHSSEELERVLDSIDSLLAKDRGPKGWPGSMVADGRLSPQAATEIGTMSTFSCLRNNITAELMAIIDVACVMLISCRVSVSGQ